MITRPVLIRTEAAPTPGNPPAAVHHLLLPREQIHPESLPLRWGYEVADLPAWLAGRIQVHPVSRCWLWLGHLDRDGYGKLRGRGVHRLVYELLVGPVPADLVLDHREDWGCLTRACCFPGHLVPVTPRENILRGIGPSALNARKAECDHGHPFDEANTSRHRSRRDCRICGRGRVRRYKARQRETAGQQDYRRAA